MSVSFAPDYGVPMSNNWVSEQFFSKYYFVVISGSSFWFQCDSYQGWRAAGSIFAPTSSPALPLPVWPQPGHSTGHDQHLECLSHWQVNGEWPAKSSKGVCCHLAVYQRSSWNRCILWKERLCRMGWGTALERRRLNPWMSLELVQRFCTVCHMWKDIADLVCAASIKIYDLLNMGSFHFDTAYEKLLRNPYGLRFLPKARASKYSFSVFTEKEWSPSMKAISSVWGELLPGVFQE